MYWLLTNSFRPPEQLRARWGASQLAAFELDEKHKIDQVLLTGISKMVTFTMTMLTATLSRS